MVLVVTIDRTRLLSSRHSSFWLNVNNPDIFIFKIYQNPEHSRFLSFHFESRHSFGWRERALTFSARRLRYEEMRMFLNRPAHRTRQRETAVSTFLSPFSSYKGISKYQNSAAKYLCGEKSKYSTLLAGVNNLNIDGVAPYLELRARLKDVTHVSLLSGDIQPKSAIKSPKLFLSTQGNSIKWCCKD